MATFNAHMKTLTFMLTALFISCASLSAYAEEMSTLYNIPERYALLVVTGADPAAPLDTEKFEALLSEEFKKANADTNLRRREKTGRWGPSFWRNEERQ